MTVAVQSRRTVSIIEDEPEQRCFMRRIVDNAPDLECFGSYASAEEALTSVPCHLPELVLVDLRLPGISGVECIQRLKMSLPDLVVVVVTGLRDKQVLQEAASAGCSAYLEKPFTIHQFLATLRFALVQADKAIKHCPTSDVHATQLTFTSREREIMSWLCRGLLYKEIAGQLNISFSLVHKIQNCVFQKLRARNRTEAVNKWQALNQKHT